MEAKATLISVIVPIYNVKKYLRKCLHSLKNQTMRQIEVIMIDDGSTDGSGMIAEEYVSENIWPDFRLIRHGENRGLSAARNTGIDNARADWLMFVDSDDWVEPDFCRLPYEAAVRENADLVIFNGLIEHKRKEDCLLYDYLSEGITDKYSAHEHGSTVVWNKLYKKKLFDNVLFPEGRIYEDFAVTHRLVDTARSIVMIQERLYHYVYRKNSISTASNKTGKHDLFISIYERYQFLLESGYPMGKLDFALLAGYAIGFLSVTKPCIAKEYLCAKRVVNSLKYAPKKFTIKQKLALVIWNTNQGLFYFMCMLLGRIKN